MNSQPIGFRSSVAHLDGNIIVMLAGELDMASAPSLRASLQELIAAGPPEIVFDLAKLDFIDSSGISVLVWAQKELSRAGRRLVIRSAQPIQLRVFELTGLTSYLNVEIEEPSEP